MKSLHRTMLLSVTSSIALALPMAANAGAGHAAAAGALEKPQAGVTQAAASTPAAQAAAAKPAPQGTLTQAAQQAGSFDTWLKAIQTAGLSNLLEGNTQYTVFAPTDEAFAKLGSEKIDALMKDEAKLTQVLKSHIIAVQLRSKDVPLGAIRALSGEKLDVSAQRRHMLNVEGANVIAPDIIATNGVMHGIDRVIVPN
jgi:uncharacterized surface protein with fasciclin (FAS1) repeats